MAFIIIFEKSLNDHRPGENCGSGSSVYELIVKINSRLHLTNVENEAGGESRM